MDKIIKIALLSLPKNLRIVIVLREYEGLSYEDISKLTNTTIGTVKSRISRARSKLQEQLKEFI
jgi:RNA polymerase sigma-70 factor (ECF subfamily)